MEMIPIAADSNPISRKGSPGFEYVFDGFLKGTFKDTVCVIRAKRINLLYYAADQNIVAIKCYQKNLPSRERKHLRREVLALKSIKSHRVTYLYEVYASDTHLCVVMEYMGGGTLHDYILRHQNGLVESDARKFFRDIVIGLGDMQNMNIANRDIKAENVVLNQAQNVAKVCDLGFARLNSSECVSRLGTPYYQAPEIWELSDSSSDNCPYDGKCVDVWSLGVLLYKMMFGIYPFSADGFEFSSSAQRVVALGQIIQRGEFTFPQGKAVSSQCYDIIKQMLTVSPNRRITRRQIMNHPWFLNDHTTHELMSNPAVSTCPQSDDTLISIINNVTIEEIIDFS
eukprot:g7351.t1